MAEENKVAEILKTFRKNLQINKLTDRKHLEKTIKDGLDHTMAEVRAIAARVGLQHMDRDWVKKNILHLLDKEPSKKVLRVIDRKHGGKKVREAVERVAKRKPATKKAAEQTDG